MAADINERSDFVKGKLKRRMRDAFHVETRGEEFAGAACGEGAAAHERAVMTVKLTLLVLAFGIILFLLDGPGSVPAAVQGGGGSVEYLK